jgi:hypothetical protein
MHFQSNRLDKEHKRLYLFWNICQNISHFNLYRFSPLLDYIARAALIPEVEGAHPKRTVPQIIDLEVANTIGVYSSCNNFQFSKSDFHRSSSFFFDISWDDKTSDRCDWLFDNPETFWESID